MPSRRRGQTPSCCLKPKAARRSIHADAKLAVREAHGLPDGHIKIIAIATETAASLFVAGYICGSERPDGGADLGRRGSFRRAWRAGQPRSQGRFLDPYRLARTFCASPAQPPHKCRRSTPCMSIFATKPDFAANARKRAAMAFPEKWPSIPRRCRSSTKCSRHRPRPWPGQGDRRGVRGQSGRGRRRARRGDVRPATSGARATAARSSECAIASKHVVVKTER